MPDPSAGPPTAPEPLRCPLCAYDLRGLPDPRCPECGHTFEWAELTDPARQTLPWFFEHRTRLGGYLPTQLRLLWPWHLFRTLRPAHRLSRPRLAVFFLLTALSIGLTAGVVVAVEVVHTAVTARAARIARLSAAASVAPDPDAIVVEGLTYREFIDLYFPPIDTLDGWRRFHSDWMRWHDFHRTLDVLLVLAVAPVLAWSFVVCGAVAVISILRQSRRRAAAQWKHVARVIVYSFDPFPIVPTVLALSAWTIAQRIFSRPPGGRSWSMYDWPSQAILEGAPWVAGAAALLFYIRFSVALRRYLGIPHAEGVALAAAVLAVLIAACTGLLVGEIIRFL